MESSSERKSPFDQLLEQRKAEGWDYVGMGQLVETKFIDGRFVEVPVKNKNEVITEQTEKLKNLVRQSGQEKDVDVELIDVPGQVVNGIEVPNKSQSFYIFAKIK